MEINKIVNKVNDGLEITEAQFMRIIKHYDLKIYLQKNYFSEEDGTLECQSYMVMPRFGKTSPISNNVFMKC